MTTLMVMMISGGLLVVFTALFHIETKRGERLLFKGFRTMLDRGVMYMFGKIARIKTYIGSGSFRIILHYYVHTILNRVLDWVETIHISIHKLQQRNRTLVKTVKELREKTHFEVIAEHKALNALSEADRQKLKERAMEGE